MLGFYGVFQGPERRARATPIMETEFHKLPKLLTLKSIILKLCRMTPLLAPDPLLKPNDPAPVEWVNGASRSCLLLVCEHAGQAIPAKLGQLGVTDRILDDHHGWDIGAEALARAVAARLEAPLILQRYSRLVIDCNRPLDTPGSIPANSFGAPIPGNVALGPLERAARANEIFEPLSDAIVDGFSRHQRSAAFSIHSFAPEMNGTHRPWHAGFLSRTDLQTGQALMDHISRARPDLSLALNEPYQIETDGDWFIPAFAERYGVAHSLIEIRNDLIRDARGVAVWADLLADAIASVTEPLE